ncbi:MAG: excinuclease ABC subunit UvrB [Deltaproteobacteria bacterium]|nr:excinuclease ABC subunit UvrB [Deltaproteobacteria bacterium]
MGVSFQLESDFEPAGDQPKAIDELVKGLARGDRHQVLLGVTGSGKTFTIANVVARTNRPAIIIAHNKTLAGQLYAEFRQFFPHNAVGFFVSYYDYYQPEAYVPQSDTYIEKDASINDEIDRMRHAATHALLTRRDVIIVASVSCIFGLGAVEAYSEMRVALRVGEELGRDALLRRLVDIQYSRNDLDFHRGTFRVRGDMVDVFPIYEDERALRISFYGDEIEAIYFFDPLRGIKAESLQSIEIFPGSHYVTPANRMGHAILSIREELRVNLQKLRSAQRLLEAQRLEQRVMYDLEMMEQMGYCNGIENYSRHLAGRMVGEPPTTLIDYLPHDGMVILDESHQSLPQLRGMVRGDRSRKETLVEYGFRLPSALDNRPLTYEEFDVRAGQRIYISATPTEFEVGLAQGVLVEQIVRPTGLVDPVVEIRPASTQVDDLLEEIRVTVQRGQRVLVTTLTKRMAEDLTEFLTEHGVKVTYLHSDIKTMERLSIVTELRAGKFDVLVGINLLREGLDMPEVSLVAILDADREGFLRSETALIQTMGRAARNLDGRVLLYADRVTPSIERAMAETARRRQLQQDHNQAQGITPRSIKKAVATLQALEDEQEQKTWGGLAEPEAPYGLSELIRRIEELKVQMRQAAEVLDFEEAAMLRDQIKALKKRHLRDG